jgi:hypothetical protein
VRHRVLLALGALAVPFPVYGHGYLGTVGVFVHLVAFGVIVVEVLRLVDPPPR